MRWLLDALKGFVLLIQDTAVVHPQAARGGFSIVLLLAVAVAGLMAINPAKFWWAPHVLIGTGVVILLLLVVGIIALGNEMAGGSGAMGGRTGVMLSDLDRPPADDRRKKPKLPVRRKGDAVPDWKVKPRAEAALALLDFLAETDRAFEHPAVVRRIEDTAVRVREAIEAGDLGPVAGRLTAAGRRQLQEGIDALAADRARQVFGKVTPVDVQLVLVGRPRGPRPARRDRPGDHQVARLPGGRQDRRGPRRGEGRVGRHPRILVVPPGQHDVAARPRPPGGRTPTNCSTC